MGLVLGFIGGGGGVLAVPILVFGFGVQPALATGQSLVLVGATSAIGAVQAGISRQIDLRRALPLAIGSVAGTFVARRWVLPSLPRILGPFTLDQVLIFGLAVFMVLIAIRLIRPRRDPSSHRDISSLTLVSVGLLIGVVSGLVGAGGGLFIVPVLAEWVGMTMPVAAGTSLLVIFLQSASGAAGHGWTKLNLPFLLPLMGVTLAGMVCGILLRGRASDGWLRRSFAILLLAIAAYSIFKIR
jgi:uncharacterized membrane protein YfcA